jgi:hypothetical protein
MPCCQATGQPFHLVVLALQTCLPPLYLPVTSLPACHLSTCLSLLYLPVSSLLSCHLSTSCLSLLLTSWLHVYLLITSLPACYLFFLPVCQLCTVSASQLSTCMSPLYLPVTSLPAHFLFTCLSPPYLSVAVYQLIHFYPFLALLNFSYCRVTAVAQWAQAPGIYCFSAGSFPASQLDSALMILKCSSVRSTKKTSVALFLPVNSVPACHLVPHLYTFL